METEVHDRNWSFAPGPSSSVITNLSRKTTSAVTDLMLFTTKRANAIKTLLDMTAASASLATMIMTARRKKTLTRKNFLKLSAEEKDQYIRYINMSRHYISNYVVTLTPYSEEVNKTVKSNHDLSCVQTLSKLWLVSWDTVVFSMKFTKSVVSFRYDFCFCAMGWSSLSTKNDNLSVGLSQPEIIGLPTGFGLWILVRV